MLDSLANAKGEILIDAQNRWWNHRMIDGIFTPEETELIKKLPLSRVVAEDSLFWPYT